MINFIEAAIRTFAFLINLHCRLVRKYLFPFGPWTTLYLSIVFFITLFIIVQYDNNPSELRKMIKMDFLPKDSDKEDENPEKVKKNKLKDKKNNNNNKMLADEESIVSDIIASIPTDRDSETFYSCDSLLNDETNAMMMNDRKDKNNVVFSTGYLEVT